MYKKLMFGVLAGLALWRAGAADLNWRTDLPPALTQAAAEKKLVLLDFTGSDWCVWCKKLEADTLTQPGFAAYAATNLVLLQVDFPNSKPQTEDLKAANQALAKKFKVEGFPTLVVLKPDGTEVWRLTGYLAGGPKALIAQITAAQTK
jgi:protein disulfide-isomerase